MYFGMFDPTIVILIQRRRGEKGDFRIVCAGKIRILMK